MLTDTLPLPHGLGRYGTDNDPRILDGEQRFIRALLASPDRTATLTDATPPEYLDRPFPDGGRWRGAVPKRLAGRGIVGQVLDANGRPAALRSSRKSRHRGILAVWKLIDPDAGLRRLQDLAIYFAENPHGSHRQPPPLAILPDDPDAGPVTC
jgi:hypothetical protein